MMVLNDLTMLTKYNFATRRFKENGNVYFDIVSTEEEKVYRVPEDLVKQIISGRKYKIVNLNLENGKVVLKDTSEDLNIVKDINFPICLFNEMQDVFKEGFFKLMQKKIAYLIRINFSKYRNDIYVINKYPDEDGSYVMYFKVKKGPKYAMLIDIKDNSEPYIQLDEMVWEDCYGMRVEEPEHVTSYDLTNQNISYLGKCLARIFENA